LFWRILEIQIINQNEKLICIVGNSKANPPIRNRAILR